MKLRVEVKDYEAILFEDESSVIIAGNLMDENIAEFIDMMETAAETVIADDAAASELSRDGDSGGFTN